MTTWLILLVSLSRPLLPSYSVKSRLKLLPAPFLLLIGKLINTLELLVDQICRLVGGLASEKVRWADSLKEFRHEELTLAGDVLLTASYLSYVGCFGRSYRLDLLQNKWMPFLKSLNVGFTFIL